MANVGGASASASSDADATDLEIVLSPIQLAAILEGGTINETETQSNRLWGGVKLLFGAIELVGGVVLLVAPEPTMVTKAGGVVLGGHGADTAAAGMRQLWYGREKTTLTAQAAEAAARSMGVDPDRAATVGMAVDIAVPLAAGFAGAARLAAVRAGRIDIVAEQAAGGHTLSKHVGESTFNLIRRLAREPRIPAASTFAGIREAEEVLSAAVKANATAIKAWASTAQVGARLPFGYDAGRIIGWGVIRATGQRVDMSKCLIVLEKAASGTKKIFFVLTSYPVP